MREKAMKETISRPMIEALVENHYTSTYGSLEAYVRQCLGRQGKKCPEAIIRRAGEALLKNREAFVENMEDCCKQMLLLSRLAGLLSEEHGLTAETRQDCLDYFLQEIQELLPEVVCYLQQEKAQ